MSKTEQAEKVEFVLTEEEWRRALRFSLRKAGPVRLAVQAVILAVVGVYSLVSFFMGNRRDGYLLLIGISSLVLIILQWIVPDRMFRREAKERVAEAKPLRLWFSEAGIAAGGDPEQPPETTDPVYGQVAVHGDIAIWSIGRQYVPVPKRVLTAAQWKRLTGEEKES